MGPVVMVSWIRIITSEVMDFGPMQLGCGSLENTESLLSIFPSFGIWSKMKYSLEKSDQEHHGKGAWPAKPSDSVYLWKQSPAQRYACMTYRRQRRHEFP